MPKFNHNLYRYFIIVHALDGHKENPIPIPEQCPNDNEAREILYQVKKLIRFDYTALELVKQLKTDHTATGIIIPHG